MIKGVGNAQDVRQDVQEHIIARSLKIFTGKTVYLMLIINYQFYKLTSYKS